jgi:acyl-CoA thioesterase
MPFRQYGGPSCAVSASGPSAEFKELSATARKKKKQQFETSPSLSVEASAHGKSETPEGLQEPHQHTDRKDLAQACGGDEAWRSRTIGKLLLISPNQIIQYRPDVEVRYSRHARIYQGLAAFNLLMYRIRSSHQVQEERRRQRRSLRRRTIFDRRTEIATRSRSPVSHYGI